jgi:hypothetical protein
MDKNSRVSVVEFRQLLITLKEHTHDTCIRVRIMGQLWEQNFMRIIHVSETHVFLRNEAEESPLKYFKLDEVMNFEIDKPFQDFKPHDHYNVLPLFVKS